MTTAFVFKFPIFRTLSHINVTSRFVRQFCVLSCHSSKVFVREVTIAGNSYLLPISRHYSDDKSKGIEQKSTSETQSVTADKPSQRDRFKAAIRDYGSTILVFHITIALASLGMFYTAISYGLDPVQFLSWVGFSDNYASSKVLAGGSTFVISYAVHKVFAPVRLGITLTVAPLIARQLRKSKLIKQK